MKFFIFIESVWGKWSSLHWSIIDCKFIIQRNVIFWFRLHNSDVEQEVWSVWVLKSFAFFPSFSTHTCHRPVQRYSNSCRHQPASTSSLTVSSPPFLLATKSARYCKVLSRFESNLGKPTPPPPLNWLFHCTVHLKSNELGFKEHLAFYEQSKIPGFFFLLLFS